MNEVATATVFGTAPAITRMPKFTRFPDGAAIQPRHALIQVSGADIRFKTNNDDPSEISGTLKRAGTEIDWTNPLDDFAAAISRFRFVPVNGGVTAQLNISVMD